jgi:cytochrome c oxidase subunit 2
MRSKVVRLGSLLVGFALVASCASDAPQDTFQPKGDESRLINNLQVPVFIAAGVVGVLVMTGALITIIRFRRRDDDAPDPVQIHGNFRLEIGWTILPAVILAFVAVGTLTTLFKLSDQPDDAMEVHVFGQQWWWSFEYDLGGGPEPEIITANDLVIPAGQEINLTLESRDVIHSFWIPALNGTRDAVPGRVHTLTIEADEPGRYLGQCKEFCGLSHANMRAEVIALSPGDFQEWTRQQQEEAAEPTEAVAQAGLAVFEAKCAQCHQINGVNEVEGGAALVSKHAPNLTHLMSRYTFASGLFDLYVLRDKDMEFNRPQLEAWLRDPPGELPMAPDQERGMPNLNLSEEEIDQLVAYLETLGPRLDQPTGGS